MVAGRLLPPLLIAFGAGPALASPDSVRLRLDVTGEFRAFPQSPIDRRQEDTAFSLSALARADFEWQGGDLTLAVSPFARIDSADDDRSHVDMREFELRYRSGNWDFRAGIGKVFWGATEFLHLVDIINQTDGVESIDGEDKLGQPLAAASYTTPFGVFTGFVLPFFRERNFPGVQGRLRGPVVIDDDNPIYQSRRKEKHVDFAARWQLSRGALDIGMAHFSGTAREPRLIAAVNGSGTVLRPVYYQIAQTSIDVSYVRGGWLWKLEMLHQDNPIEDYQAAIVGVEYTFAASMESPEIGVLVEYAWDARGNNAPTAFQNDVFLGLRVGMNDMSGTEFLAGIGQDLHYDARYFSLDASRRFGANSRVGLKLRSLDGTAPGDALSAITRDDHVILEYTRYF